MNAQAGAARLFPQPPGFPEFDVGPLRVTRAYSGMLILTPILVVGLTIFLRRSRYGIAIRGSADNPDAARMAGVSAGRMSTLSWAIAGAVSAFTAILIFPTRGFVTVESLGPSLLLRALVAAVIARMRACRSRWAPASASASSSRSCCGTSPAAASSRRRCS